MHLFIYFWLQRVSVAVHGVSLVVVSGVYSLVTMCGLLIVVVFLIVEHRF